MKTIGILGGMGPEATSDFFAKLLSFDKAAKDQDHVHIIIESDPSILGQDSLYPRKRTGSGARDARLSSSA